jgi:hypothetical protein
MSLDTGKTSHSLVVPAICFTSCPTKILCRRIFIKDAERKVDGDMMILDHIIPHSVGPNWSSTYVLILESRRISNPTNNTVRGMLIDCGNMRSGIVTHLHSKLKVEVQK